MNNILNVSHLFNYTKPVKVRITKAQRDNAIRSLQTWTDGRFKDSPQIDITCLEKLSYRQIRTILELVKTNRNKGRDDVRRWKKEHDERVGKL